MLRKKVLNFPRVDAIARPLHSEDSIASPAGLNTADGRRA